MRGRPKAELVLTEDEREQLTALTLRRKTAQALALRARIVLACAEGVDNKVVASRQRVTPQTVSKWRARFVEHRLDGLLDAPRPGAPRTIEDTQVDAVIAKTLESVPEGATHWSTRTMAREAGLSQTAVSRIWRAFGLQPHRQDTFKLSSDPLFVEKVRDIVGLYMDPPLMAMVLCVDEKSQIQALDRTQPMLPLAPGHPRAAHPRLRAPWHHHAVRGAGHRHRSRHRRAASAPPQQRVPAVPAHHRSQRAGNAGHPPRDGQLRHAQDACHQELARPASALSRALHADLRVLAEPGRTLVRHPDAKVHPPRDASLHAPTRASHQALHQDQQRDPKPFVWSKTADDILASIERFCLRTSNSRH